MPNQMEKLNVIRKFSGKQRTPGLPDAVIERFLADDPTLGQAIDLAEEMHRLFSTEHTDWLRRDEEELRLLVQQYYVNFYPDPDRS